MKKMIQAKMTRLLFVTSFLVGMVTGAGFAAAGQVTQEGNATCFTQSESEASQPIDFANAKPAPMPRAAVPAVGPFEGGISTESLGTPRMEPGAIGTGKTTPGATGAGETISGATATQTGAEEQTSADSEEKTPEEFGTANIPYTTSRVDLTTAHNESKSYPYSAAGVLYRVLNSTTAEYCSASLVKRGVIVTAGHCVANFGKSQFYSGWVFWPGASQSGPTYTFPFGQWKVSKAWVLTSYYNGTDPCEEAGVVCQDDVAVLAITPQSGKLPGTATGWFGYGVNGWGFTSTNITQITQLGYPISHDNGQLMQRTDSQGFVSSSMSNNTIWGSRQTGGSSGGPVVVNFGVAATLSGGTTFGTDSTFNQLVGVTSWDTDAIKEQGASPFTSANVAYLVGQACTAYPANCK